MFKIRSAQTNLFGLIEILVLTKDRKNLHIFGGIAAIFLNKFTSYRVIEIGNYMFVALVAKIADS